MRIEIDPEREAPSTLRALAVFFNTVAGGIAPATQMNDNAARAWAGHTSTVEEIAPTLQETAMGAGGGGGTPVTVHMHAQPAADGSVGTVIAAVDNPATGAPDAASVFTGQPADPASVFAAPTQPDAAAVFGGASGNVAPAGAGVAALPTVPAVPPAGVPTPPTATQPVVATGAVTGSVAPTHHANGVEIDAEGVPWDVRIHAGTRTKTVKGVWKARKGLNDDGLVARIKNELRAVMAIPAPPSVAAVQVPGVPAPFTDTPAPAFPAAAVPAVPGVPVMAVAQPTGITFPELMIKFTGMVRAGRATSDMLLTACRAHGLANPALLSNKPELVGQVDGTLESLLTPLQ